MEKPQQLEEVRLQPLQDICKKYLDFLDSREYSEDNDFAVYIFETALESVYGDDVWNYVNNRMQL